MAEEKRQPPVDRPLHKSYWKRFTGWSTAAAPGLSAPTSLRRMHNCEITPEGALRVRPGKRRVFTVPAPGDIVGTFEHFYSHRTLDGVAVKTLLFAVRAEDDGVDFMIARDLDDSGHMTVEPAENLFDVRVGDQLRFSDPDADVERTTYVKYLQIDNKILALSNNEESFRLFEVGATKQARVVRPLTRPLYESGDAPVVTMPSATWIEGEQLEPPDEGTPGAETLVSSTAEDNKFNFGYFYTFSNDVGESAPSKISTIKTQRRWTAWEVDAEDEPQSPDQLGIKIPAEAWQAALDEGALNWNLYFLTWTDQDVVPVEGNLLTTVAMSQNHTYNESGWTTHTPLMQGLDATRALPSMDRDDNYSAPSSASQGLVAGDRIVLVYDPSEAAKVRWSSNLQGEYLNFSSSKGGGYKTLTSGNLYTPAAVKLWQNPQAIDTLVVINMGLDGYSNAHYMNPGTTIETQLGSITVMGFEETTATPGTVSPFGCEVLNNALYHPLENNLMKSTAANYSINHSMMADDIQNMWREVQLQDKERMVSSQMDSSLYYLVRSPAAWFPDTEANGDQIWICDTDDGNIWSVWDVAGTALRKLEIGGKLYMGLTSGANIYVFDPEQRYDDEWDGSAWVEKDIPWEAISNTQGANAAHDAWAQLQQANVMFGSFSGECEYGVRGVDVYGNPVEVLKHYRGPEKDWSILDHYNQQDYLLIRRIMREWEFVWRSVAKPRTHSGGNINYVQYAYAPATVNVAYEYGSVETFEYSNSNPTFRNAVPLPNADVSKHYPTA